MQILKLRPKHIKYQEQKNIERFCALSATIDIILGPIGGSKFKQKDKISENRPLIQKFWILRKFYGEL